MTPEEFKAQLLAKIDNRIGTHDILRELVEFIFDRVSPAAPASVIDAAPAPAVIDAEVIAAPAPTNPT